MIFSISKIEQGTYHDDTLQNPKNIGNPMTFVVFRQFTRTALFSVHSKKAYGEFWDKITQKKIARSIWTPEMKTFAREKVAETRKPPFIFKLTIFGWLFLLLVVAFFGMVIYQEAKPPVPKSAEYVAMEKAPAVGDILYGHYEIYKEKGNPIGTEIGFGWFKINKIDGDNYYLSKSTETSKTSKPKEQMNHTNFETEDLPMVQLSEQTGYNMRFKSADGLTEIYISDKN